MLCSRSLLVVMQQFIISSSLLGVVVFGPLQGMPGFHVIISVSSFLTHLTLAVKSNCVATTLLYCCICSETILNAKLNQTYLYWFLGGLLPNLCRTIPRPFIADIGKVKMISHHKEKFNISLDFI